MRKIIKKPFAFLKKPSIRILRFLNYNCINNEDGTNHRVLNTIDIGLSLAYAIISFLSLGNMTILVFVLNLITALRLIFKELRLSSNLKAEFEKKTGEKVGTIYKSPHELKTIIEVSTLIVGSAISFIVGWRAEGFAQGLEYFGLGLAFIMVFITLFEHIINVMVDYFEATVVLENIVMV